MESTSKVAIVTGGSRGIGRAIALRLAARGMHVVVAARSMTGPRYGEELGAATVPDEIIAMGRQSLAFEGDLCERSTCKALIERTLAAFGRIDVLVNNAGGALTPIERSMASVVPDEDFELLLQLNLMSTVYCCQEALPSMRERRAGSIVNISSRAGLDPSQRQGRLAAYGVAKTGAIQYSRFLAADVGPDNIRVNCVAPGAIATARIVQSAQARGISTDADLQGIPLRRFGSADEVASVVEFFASDASAYVTGQCLSVCGGTVLTPS
ncbi:MAG: SDR family NAD(P)-dependent oxidoreductase [Burkholderiales bacterium]